MIYLWFRSAPDPETDEIRVDILDDDRVPVRAFVNRVTDEARCYWDRAEFTRRMRRTTVTSS